jgi:hypothetical protein
MGSYFTKPVTVTLGDQTKKARLFDTYGDFRSWAHRAFGLQGSANSYSIRCLDGSRFLPFPSPYMAGGSLGASVIHLPTSTFDNPTRLWLVTEGISYEFGLSYDINGPQQ